MKKTSKGDLQPRHLRGRRLILLVKAVKKAGSKHSRSVDLGQYSRMSPLVFSFVPRIQGAWGGEKKKGTLLSAAEISSCLANSLPRSGVIERTSSGGSSPSSRIMPSRTCAEVFLGILKDILDCALKKFWGFNGKISTLKPEKSKSSEQSFIRQETSPS